MAASCLQFAHIINIAYHVIPSSENVNISYYFGEKKNKIFETRCFSYTGCFVSNRNRVKIQFC